MKVNKSNSWAPWIAFTAAILTLLCNIYLNISDRNKEREYLILENRRITLFKALKVIDNVYANSDFTGMPKSVRKEWDISEARDVMNGILVYCEDPNKTINSFMKAIGLHNPNIESPPIYNMGMINDFRHDVIRELKLPTIIWADSNQTWIFSLPGTKEELSAKKYYSNKN